MDTAKWLETVPEDLLEELQECDSATIKMLTGLNPSQLRAVMTIFGPVQINAVAGSGKTRVLTHRIAYMLKQGVKAQNILCTTFTKKATEEMKERLSTLIPKMALDTMTIGTSHSIGYRILAKEYANLGHHLTDAFNPRKSKVLMNFELKKFSEEVKKSIMYDKTIQFDVKEALRDTPLPQILKVISSQKNEGIDVYEFEAKNSGKGAKSEMYVEYFKRYEEKKWYERKIDADDMLILLVKLFKEYPDILEKYRGFYKYILVDEAQDNNLLQYELIQMLGAPNYNIFIVGDDDQSMYGFRGAKPEQFIDFSQNYRGVTQIALEDNYRSRPEILQVANSLIKNNTKRLIKELRPHSEDDSQSVVYSSHKDEAEEANEVVKQIQVEVQEGYKPKEIAILYRTNAQSRSFEDQLIMAGLPYVIHGGISFYERREVKDLVSYLKLSVDPNNDRAFQRVYNVPSRYLGKAFYEKVKAFKGSHYEAVQCINLKDYERRGVGEFISLVESLRDMNGKGLTPTEMVDFIMEDCYEQYLKDEGEDEDEGSSRLENIATLKFVLQRYENVEDFLDYIEMMTSKAKHSIDGVQLMTIHKSKGLEFPVVFQVGCSQGLLPHFKAVEASENGKPLAIEEERRLLYVGITRAESKCFISSSGAFNGNPAPPSQFVKELGLKEVELAHTTGDEDEKWIEEKFREKVLVPIAHEQDILMRDIMED